VVVDSQPKSAKQQFMIQLQSEAAKSLDAAAAQMLAIEVEAHLDESIQARLELGEPSEIAEINAVAGFADARRFVRQMTPVHGDRTRFDRRLLITGLCFLSWVAFFDAGVMASREIAYLIGIGGAILALGAYAFRSARIGCVRWGTLAQVSAIGFFLFALVHPLMWLDLWDQGAMGYVPVTRVSQFREAQYERELHGSVNDGVSGAPSPQEDLAALDKALKEPLTVRYMRTVQSSIGFAFFLVYLMAAAHLAPIIIVQRFRKRRRSRPTSA
jgi:hypothetical protein